MDEREKQGGDNPLLIPFGKAVRVRNFKLWRSMYSLGSGKEKADVECVNVSSLDGSWLVRIPSTMSVYSMVVQGYATADEDVRDNFLGMVFTNYYNLTTLNSEALHDSFFFLSEMMTYPYLLLSEGEMRRRMKVSLKAAGMSRDAVREHVASMVSYRRQLYAIIDRKKDAFIKAYERQMLDRLSAASDEDAMMDDDALAEDAAKIINEEGGYSE